MDWTQISITIIVSLSVSIFVWMLTYVIPYIWPTSISKILSSFTKISSDYIEIKIYINQFLKYDDWKRLTARDRLNKIFKNKIREIEEYQLKRWNKLSKNVISKPINEVYNDIKELNSFYSKDHVSSSCPLLKNPVWMDIKEVEPYFGGFKTKKFKQYLEKELSDLEESLLQNEDGNIWFYADDQDLDKWGCEKNLFEFPQLTPNESLILIHEGNYKVDSKNKFDINEILIKVFKFKEEPKISNENDLKIKFDQLIEYIDSPRERSEQEELIFKLARGLSDQTDSDNVLLSLLNNIESEKYSKRYKELYEFIDQ
ncbi:hypothetical protein [Methanobacterium aggregans]|uniref:hypothetical protein n=1 Tax=Methanobacterium aggregans TaxID=1615586 RepID=UPI001AE874A5|nr:hypothetical protein [Methanobacterium aggregans]MBP2045291.1 hypothetical protein [Methanobacterium aggregans]